jgi:hypothetical protein
MVFADKNVTKGSNVVVWANNCWAACPEMVPLAAPIIFVHRFSTSGRGGQADAQSRGDDCEA